MIRLLAMAGTILLVCGCGGGGDHDEVPGSAVQVGDAAGAHYSVNDFQALRYLEGDWRGSGYEGGPFYESYQFADDSTIEMTAWTDSTMSTARERSRYVLRDGMITNEEGARLVRIDQEGHHFASASSAWTFRSLSPDRWTARVGPSTTYTMDRVSRR